MKTILSNVTPDDVRMDPYPHIVIENVLPEEICDQLCKEFPETHIIAKDRKEVSNTRFDYTVKDMHQNKKVSPLWQEFMEVNSSDAFLKDVFRIFKDAITTYHPHLIPYTTGEKEMKSGIRYEDSHDTHDIVLDAHIGINTPVTEASSVRTAHLDDPLKLYGGLLYLRDEDDDTKGGEFVVYRYKKGVKPVFVRNQVLPHCVEEVTRVPYKRNTLALFLNTFDSVHGVTPRQPTEHTRKFLNVVGEFDTPLFDIEPYRERGIKQFLRKLKNKLGIQEGVEQRK